MKNGIASIALAAAASILAACATTPPAPARTVDGMLVNGAGMTLYTFDRDVGGSGKSVCNGPCATNWPPLIVADAAMAKGDWSVVSRDDGLKQWAYKGKPLYVFAKDGKPGDKTGDGFLNGAWHIAKP